MEHVTAQMLAEACGGRILCGDPRREVSHIRLDSRKAGPGDLFVPLIGERVDAHRFIGQVAAAGAAAVLTSEQDTEDEALSACGVPESSSAAGGGYWDRTNGAAAGPRERGIPVLIRVDDTKRALQALGRFLRGRLSLPLVGVTGSVGKTTTRELIAAALSARYRVYKTPGNSNSQVGVPITISEISPADEIGVIELGMSMPGELTVIAQIAQIDTAVITNIGITHIEQLGSRENIFKEKMTIQDGLRDGGLLIVNGDDDMLAHAQAKPGVTVLTYGLSEGCDYRAEDIRLIDGKPEFTLVCAAGRQKIVLQVLGRHNVWNALAAAAVCVQYGMTLAEAASGLRTFTGFAHRQQVFEGTVPGDKSEAAERPEKRPRHVTVLDDSYNASPVSMRAALDVFREIGAGRRHVAILADMKELGEHTRAYHRDVGRYAAESGVDILVTLGELGRELAAGAREAVLQKEDQESGKSAPVIAEFMEKGELEAYLERTLAEGDYLLFKGSNSMGLSELADRCR